MLDKKELISEINDHLDTLSEKELNPILNKLTRKDLVLLDIAIKKSVHGAVQRVLREVVTLASDAILREQGRV